MADSNKILQIVEPGLVVWREAPMPDLEAGEVLVRVTGVTTCPHWDLHILNGVPMFEDRPLAYPCVPGEPGHEAVGIVEAIGAEVQEMTVGTRVVAWRDPGGRSQGCYARYVPIRAEDLVPVPGDLPDEALAPLELAMCVQVSFDQLEGRGGVAHKRIGIGGLGPAGLIAVQMAKAYGAHEVVAFDLLDARRALAARLGADAVHHPDAFEPDRHGPDAFDVALDTTGLKTAIEYLMRATRETVAIFGVLREEVAFGPAYWWGDFALLGYGEHNRESADKALRLVQDRRLDLSALVSHTLPIARYTEGIDLLRRKEAVKILFQPGTD